MKDFHPKAYAGAIALCMTLCLMPALDAQTARPREVESWITTADRSSLLRKQTRTLAFGPENRRGMAIIVDERQSFQPIDGFGFALTEGSAFHLHRMTPAARRQLLEQLFATGSPNAGISYIRLTLGASDLNNFVYSYDDLAPGETDYELRKFSLGHDRDDILPVLKEILTIAPDIRILASPWSAPAWMKANNNVRDGSLRPECYDVYARYFVRYIQEMAREGIRIDAVTVQNEPLNSRNTPSMPWLWQEHAEFVGKHLGPAFRRAAIETKIIIFDHNCDRPDYPLAILNDPETASCVDGSAFHHYGGYLSAMSVVHTARPDKNIYFTEQMLTERPQSETIQIAASVKRLIIDVTRNWSRNVILWNLAADPLNDPHTDNGGCSMCQGAVTIDGDLVTFNIAYYTLAHASSFVPSGSVRIASTQPFDPGVDLTQDEERPEVRRATLVPHSEVLPNVAFLRPDGRIVLIVANTGGSETTVKIQSGGQYVYDRLPSGATATYVW
ncbi:MAG: glucosylceramidase [Tannerellaceae bacterium]|jgi:glucosylceramidase|nr:glucosylceramidase [Tannerellaceae bacterium]